MIQFLASLLGHVRGGLSYVLIGAMYLVSGISGSKIADMAAIAPVLFPEMKKRGAKEGDLVALLAATGAPLAAPSANASNGISPTRAEHVAASLGGRVSLIVDDGACQEGVESTIVAGRTLLRPGPVTLEMLGRVVPVTPGATTHVSAPGQLALHYAPSKPLRLAATSAQGDEWLIGFGPVAGDDSLSASGDLTEAAARLFDALHRADAGGRARIAVAPVPDEGLGLAINDRLRRAAGASGTADGAGAQGAPGGA